MALIIILNDTVFNETGTWTSLHTYPKLGAGNTEND